MASDELSSKLSRRLQIEEGAEDPVAVDVPGQQNGSKEKATTANADSELGAKLMRREELNEGLGGHCQPSMRVFNPYTEFKEVTCRSAGSFSHTHSSGSVTFRVEIVFALVWKQVLC